MHKFFIILGILLIICAVVLSQCVPKGGLNLQRLIISGPG
jgi:hypothetical protein